jgi:uncharacterized protein (TIRG00374 family)
MSRRLRVALEAAVSAAVLAALVWWSDPARIVDALAGTHAGWLGAAAAVNTATVWLMAWRWQLLAATKGMRPGIGWMTRTTFVALFLGQFLPTAVGGDAVRAIELGRRTGRGSEAVASVLMDRLVGLVALVALAVVALAAGGDAADQPGLLAIEVALGLAAALLLALLFSSRVRELAARWLVPRSSRGRLSTGARFYDALHGYREARGALAAVFALALAVQAVRIGVVWMAARAIGADVTAGELVVAVPVMFAALVVPVALNGIGVREAVFVYFLRDGDTSAAEAFALGVEFFAVGTATALVGAAILAVRGARYGAGAVRPAPDVEAGDRPVAGA